VSINDLALDQSTIERNLAEAEAFKAQADRDSAQAECNRHMAAYHAASSRYSVRDYAWRELADSEHRIYHMIGDISEDSAHMATEYLSRWARADISKPVEIHLSTFGGSAFAGMALVDDILAHRRNGLYLIIRVRGTAASMGAILLQAADKRVVGPSSTLLIHKLSTMVAGSLDQIEDMQTWLKIVQERAVDMFAERCAAAITATRPLTRPQIKAGMNRKDWAIGPSDSVALGLADEIG
jgi:ATP-dependent protease ClpP protease subunit